MKSCKFNIASHIFGPLKLIFKIYKINYFLHKFKNMKNDKIFLKFFERKEFSFH